jgi:hypothetical protein
MADTVATRPSSQGDERVVTDPQERRALGDEALERSGERRHRLRLERDVNEVETAPGSARRAKSRGRRRGKEPQESNSSLADGSLVESFEPPRTRGTRVTAGSKVVGGRVVAERRHVPVRVRNADRYAPTRPTRP